MKTLAYKINQWNVGLRSLFLLVLLLGLITVWYFFLEKSLLENNQSFLIKQAQNQTLVKELNALLAMRGSFIYKNQLQAVQLKQVFQSALSGNARLTIASYTDNPAVLLSAGARQFAAAVAFLNLPLFNSIQQLPATIVFSGEFESFVTYLQVLQAASNGIYFNSIDFDMNRYPKAKITMKVFTLEGVS